MAITTHHSYHKFDVWAVILLIVTLFRWFACVEFLWATFFQDQSVKVFSGFFETFSHIVLSLCLFAAFFSNFAHVSLTLYGVREERLAKIHMRPEKARVLSLEITSESVFMLLHSATPWVKRTTRRGCCFFISLRRCVRFCCFSLKSVLIIWNDYSSGRKLLFLPEEVSF